MTKLSGRLDSRTHAVSGLDRERQLLVSLLPEPDFKPEMVARLAAGSPQALAELVLELRQPWWRRRSCALALRGQVPAADLSALVGRMQDPKEVTEIRCALLAVLSDDARTHTGELLAWLRSQAEHQQPYGLAEALLAARARFGDASAAPALSLLAFDPWSHVRLVGEAGLDALRAALGREEIIAALGAASLSTLAFAAPRAADRWLGVRWLKQAGLDVSPALSDAEVAIAQDTHELIADGSGPSDAELYAIVERGAAAVVSHTNETSPTGPAGACLWALCVLARRGHHVRERWEELGTPRVPMGMIPEDIRLAVVREYVPQGQRGTDPRWFLEHALVTLPEPPQEQEQLAAACAALTEAGLSPAVPISAGCLHQQGEGSYHAIDVDGGRILVSTLGPFATSDDELPRAGEALARAGLRFINDSLLDIKFTGLPVYFFGHREPLCIRDLLFYWQD